MLFGVLSKILVVLVYSTTVHYTQNSASTVLHVQVGQN